MSDFETAPMDPGSKIIVESAFDPMSQDFSREVTVETEFNP